MSTSPSSSDTRPNNPAPIAQKGKFAASIYTASTSGSKLVYFDSITVLLIPSYQDLNNHWTKPELLMHIGVLPNVMQLNILTPAKAAYNYGVRKALQDTSAVAGYYTTNYQSGTWQNINTGSLTITTFDTVRHQLSGSFSFDEYLDYIDPNSKTYVDGTFNLVPYSDVKVK
ncbi:MAG: hypothetical protein ABI444_05115 [Candidatus Kapaibacterium sp.]|jgi:hypothetical protein